MSIDRSAPTIRPEVLLDLTLQPPFRGQAKFTNLEVKARYRHRHRNKINAQSREYKTRKRREKGAKERRRTPKHILLSRFIGPPKPRKQYPRKPPTIEQKDRWRQYQNFKYQNDPQFRIAALARSAKRAVEKRLTVNAEKRDWHIRKTKEDILYALAQRLRSRIHMAFRSRKVPKPSRCADLLGCSIQAAKDYLAARFKEGMTWENWSEWHIDHIKPLAHARDVEELKELLHYTNLQPLWKRENLSKGARYVG